MAKLPGPCALSPIGLQRYALILAIPLALSVSYRPAVAQTFSNFSLPAAYCTPALASCILDGITAGPDGALWFTDYNYNFIGRITTAGVITEFPLPTKGSAPNGITVGPDGALWFTEKSEPTGKIGRITTAGLITEFAIPPGACGGSVPLNITTGSDGALWFTDVGCGNVDRITTTGIIAEFPILPTATSTPYGITAGPDGALWVTDQGNGDYYAKIDRITTDGVVTQFPLRTFLQLDPYGITVGPDGALWFTEYANIGRITTAGVITEFPTGAELWLSLVYRDRIGRRTVVHSVPNRYWPYHDRGHDHLLLQPELHTGTPSHHGGAGWSAVVRRRWSRRHRADHDRGSHPHPRLQRRRL